jgi:hypothetical protein
MKQWILLILVCMVLFIATTFREGVDETLSSTNCSTFWDTVIDTWSVGTKAELTQPTCVPYAPSWVVQRMTDGTLLDSSGNPTVETKNQSIVEKNERARYAVRQAASANYAASSGYADLVSDLENPDVGDVPAAEDVSSSRDVLQNRSSTGTVFGENGPFADEPSSDQPVINPPSSVFSNSLDSSESLKQWGTKGVRSPDKLPVEGPDFGGFESSSSSGNPFKSKPDPSLYGPSLKGPTGGGSTSSQTPGDQDIVPPYLQSDTYSLANGRLKTNPVPFLSDFLVFQK